MNVGIPEIREALRSGSMTRDELAAHFRTGRAVMAKPIYNLIQSGEAIEEGGRISLLRRDLPSEAPECHPSTTQGEKIDSRAVSGPAIATIQTATKPLVDDLLARNVRNRNARPAWVQKLKQEMLRGEYFLTNQGIGVDLDGVLIDGQNRLLAIRDAGYPPVPLLIVYNLDPRAQTKIDTGLRRSLSDLLKLILGKPNIGSLKAAICNCLWDSNSPICRGTDQLNDIAEFLESNDETVSAVISSMGGKGRAGVLAALCEYSVLYGKDNALSFASQIHLGENLQRHDPAYRLREFLRKRNGGGQDIRREDREVTICACKAHHDGKSLNALHRSNWDGKGNPQISV